MSQSPYSASVHRRRDARPVAAAVTLAVALLGGCGMFGPTRTQVARQQAQARVVTAEKLKSQGRLDDAIAQFSQAIAENPTLTSAHMGLGEVYQEKGDYAAAEVSFRRATELEPSSFKAQYAHALVLQLLDRLADAVRAYLRALSIQPDDFEANRNLATAYLQLDEPRQALPYALRAVQLDGRDGPARVNLGAVYAAMGEYNQAVLEYQAAAERMDLTPPLLLNLADSLGKAGRYEEMANTLSQLVRLTPSAAAYERLGFAYFRLNRYDDALGAFRKALSIDPNHYPALNGVGVCLLNEYLVGGRTDVAARDAALASLRKSIRINRNQPKIVELVTRYG